MKKKNQSQPTTDEVEAFKRKRKKRTRVIATLLFLIALSLCAGIVVLVMWQKPALNENEVMLLYTKSGGFHPTTLSQGESLFLPAALIPGNLKRIVVDCSPREYLLKNSSQLPSGSYYAKILSSQNNIDFSYTLEMRIVYTVNKEEIPVLAQDKLFSPENPDQFYETITKEIEASVLKEMYRLAADPTFTTTGNYQPVVFADKMKEYLSNTFQSVTTVSVVINTFSFPDLQLYSKAREIALKTLSIENEAALKESVIANASKALIQERQIEQLKKVGELLKENPQLLEYIKMSQSFGKDPLKPVLE